MLAPPLNTCNHRAMSLFPWRCIKPADLCTICLTSCDEVKCLYYGSPEENLGSLRPRRWTTTNSLTSITNPREPQAKERLQKPHSSVIKSIETCLQEEYSLGGKRPGISSKYIRVKQLLRALQKRKIYTYSLQKSVWACTHHRSLVLFADKQSLRRKLGDIVFQSLLVGSLSFDLAKFLSRVFSVELYQSPPCFSRHCFLERNRPLPSQT